VSVNGLSSSCGQFVDKIFWSYGINYS